MRSIVALFIGGVICLSGCTKKPTSEPGNTLHLSTTAKIKGLDPIYADDLYSGTESNQSYETLYHYHHLIRPYTLVPELAESMPEVSSDGRIYTIKLKKDVLFQDDECFKLTQGKGRELTAEDVLYSFKRIADPKLTSPAWWIFEDEIVGLDGWRAEASRTGQSSYNAPIEGLKAIDRYTLQIKLVNPSPRFLYVLAMHQAGIVPQEAVDYYGKEFLNHAVGTGPFRLTEYNPNSKIVWTRNPTYRRETYPSEGSPGDKEAGLVADAGKVLPLSDRVVVQIIVEDQPRWLNFMSGQLDLSNIPKDNYSSAVTLAKDLSPDLVSKGISLIKSSTLDITHTTFNMEDPLLGKNKLLRQAMSLAYDEATNIELFYNGRALAAQGPIPPGMEGYDPKFKNQYRQFNLTKAKELLAKAGYPEGKNLPPIEFAYIASSTGRQSAELGQKMMAAIGINLKLTAYSWPQFLETVKNKKAQMWSYAWLADYPDAENFLQLFYSKNVSPGQNDANYRNPEFDKLYEKSLRLPSGAKRTALYKKMAEMVVEDCPWIFHVHRLSYTLTHKWFKNFKPNDFDHGRYKYYRVDLGAKK